MANGHGGKRKGAGRKSKVEEEKIRRLAVDAIVAEYGSEEKGWAHIAESSRKSIHHLRLLWEYGYGKPKEKVDLSLDSESIPIAQWIKNDKSK